VTHLLPQRLRRGASPYGIYHAFGADRPALVLVPAVVAEIKQALYDLGAYHADPQKVPAPSIDPRWKSIDLHPDRVGSWDPASADELTIAVGRARPGHHADDPYTQMSPPGPQPTPTGVELLYQAVGTAYGVPPAIRMPLYAAWRGGVAPTKNDPVVLTQDYGPHYVTAPSAILAAHPEIAIGIQGAEHVLLTAWGTALLASSEAERDGAAIAMEAARTTRDSLVQQARSIAGLPPTDPPPTPIPFWGTPGGFLLLAGGAVGILWLLSGRGRY
jgi:hypothetical protein